jgi:hypothetical protein
MQMNSWNDPPWIRHLFGNEREEQEDFQAGTLVFYPTWFDKVGFEVINPHDRSTRAGRQPIYYEVVPAEAQGKLRLLYAPLPGESARVQPSDFLDKLLDSIKELLETYGISAKRTAGWGAARIKLEESKVHFLAGGWVEELVGLTATVEVYKPPTEEFNKLMDEKGVPIPILLDEKGELKSPTQLRKVKENKPFTSSEYGAFKDWYDRHGKAYQSMIAGETNTPVTQPREISLKEFLEAVEKLNTTQAGGTQ